MSGVPGSYNLSSLFAFDANKAWATMWSWQMNGGLLETSDGGLTWTQDPNAFKTETGGIAPEFVYFFDANHGVSVGDPNDGYFEIDTTTNAGGTWTRVPQASIPALVSGELGVGGRYKAAGNSLWFPTYALGTGRILKTTDRGLTWSLVIFPGTASDWVPIIAFQDENIGIGNGDWGDVKKTTDGGSTWTAIPTSLKLGTQFLKYVPGTPGMYVASAIWKYGSLAQQYLYGTLYTIDTGAHWTMATASTVESTPDLVFSSPTSGWRGDPSPNIFKWTVPAGRFVGVHPDSLVFSVRELGLGGDTIAVDLMNYGSDPVTLSSVSMPGTQFTVIQQPTLPAILPSLGAARVRLCYSPTVSGTHQDSLIFVSNASNTPRARVYLEGKAVKFGKGKHATMYAVSTSLYSVDPATGTPTAIGSLGGSQFGGLAFDTSGLLHGSITGSTTTTIFHICCDSAVSAAVRTFPIGNMQAIAFNWNNVLYGASNVGRLYRLDLATGDTIGIGPASGVAYGSIAFSPKSGQLFASVNSGSSGKDSIYKIDPTTGRTTPVGATGDKNYTPAIFFDPDGLLYGLKTVGLKHSSSVVAIDTVNGTASTKYSNILTGVTSMTMLDMLTSVIEPKHAMPMEFALMPSYPNPFNPSTTIRFELPKASQVKLTVYDLLGREVVVLVNEPKPAGGYEVKFDGSNLASGVYFYRLQAGSFVATKKLLLLR